MAVVRCPNGHYYDDVKHSNCPHCLSGSQAPSASHTDPVIAACASGGYRSISLDAASSSSDANQLSKASGKLADDAQTVAYNSGLAKLSDDAQTVAYNSGSARLVGNPGDSINAKLSRLTADERTVGYFQRSIQMDPVVGWLVCLEGPERGRDYRLHVGQNLVGRAFSMDVALNEDTKVSRERHCSVVYEPLQNRFFLVPGEGTATYLGDTLLTVSVAIQDGDTIRIGDTTLVFVPFCREGFTWL